MVSKSKVLKCYQCNKELEKIKKIDGEPSHSHECPSMHCAININNGEINKYILFIMENGIVKYKIEQDESNLYVWSIKRKYNNILRIKDTFIPLCIKNGEIKGVDKLLKRLYKLVAFI